MLIRIKQPKTGFKLSKKLGICTRYTLIHSKKAMPARTRNDKYPAGNDNCLLEVGFTALNKLSVAFAYFGFPGIYGHFST
ncbi:hypothetical protein ACVWYF_000680 [Hymenobacter sp. UYAg731]